MHATIENISLVEVPSEAMDDGGHSTAQGGKSPLRLALNQFWGWYEAHAVFTIGIAAVLFLLQLGHLYWLTTDVVAARLLGRRLFEPTPLWRALLILFDYTELPAIAAASLVYLSALRRRFSWRDTGYLVAVNIQLFHIFWITDEFVVEAFHQGGVVGFPTWLAWVAILIDYLELPVIVETIRRFIVAVRTEPTEPSTDENE